MTRSWTGNRTSTPAQTTGHMDLSQFLKIEVWLAYACLLPSSQKFWGTIPSYIVGKEKVSMVMVMFF